MSAEAEKPFKCDCGESFDTEEELDQHRKTKADNSGSNFTKMSAEAEKPFKCDCGESFDTEEELDQHRKTKADNSGSNLK